MCSLSSENDNMNMHSLKGLAKIHELFTLSLFTFCLINSVLFVLLPVTLVTDLISSLSLLSLSYSLSFLTSSGEVGTNQLATHLNITTTCWAERDNALN